MDIHKIKIHLFEIENAINKFDDFIEEYEINYSINDLNTLISNHNTYLNIQNKISLKKLFEIYDKAFYYIGLNKVDYLLNPKYYEVFYNYITKEIKIGNSI